MLINERMYILFGKHVEAPYCTFLILFKWVLSNIHSNCNLRSSCLHGYCQTFILNTVIYGWVVYMGIFKHSF